MLHTLDRRQWMAAAAATAGSLLAKAPQARAGELSGRIKKGLKYHMIAEDLPVTDKFKLVKDLGFEGLEVHRRYAKDPAQFVKASQAADFPIHGVLNSSDPDLKGAVDLAVEFGATSVLVVAGRVTPENAYDKNYRHTQAWLKEASAYAQERQIRLLVENVWNNFLVSPLEMARYLDEIGSPYVGGYFDIGNVMRYGFPDQWIRILGKRIGKLDVKEYSLKKLEQEGLRKGFESEIGDGDVPWAAVRTALLEIGYRGWATAEVPAGDRQRLADIARRMDQVLGLV
jgi:hexulose-6-phosphate isomerase